MDWDQRFLYNQNHQKIMDFSGVNGFGVGIFSPSGNSIQVIQTNWTVYLGNTNNQGLTIASSGNATINGALQCSPWSLLIERNGRL